MIHSNFILEFIPWVIFVGLIINLIIIGILLKNRYKVHWYGGGIKGIKNLKKITKNKKGVRRVVFQSIIALAYIVIIVFWISILLLLVSLLSSYFSS